MPTVNSKELVDQIITNEGHYEDDPIVLAIHQYTNDWGGVSYHLAYSNNELISLFSSPCCHDIIRLWP